MSLSLLKIILLIMLMINWINWINLESETVMWMTLEIDDFNIN